MKSLFYLFKYKLTQTIISKIAMTSVANVFALDITFFRIQENFGKRALEKHSIGYGP